MSGGSMDYVYGRIDEAASVVQRELAQAKLRHSKGIYPTETVSWKKKYIKGSDGKFAKDSNGNRKFWKIADKQIESEDLSLRVISHLEDALLAMRLAAIYAERVEWLTSGDDGEQSFCERLEEQLAEAKRTGGVS